MARSNRQLTQFAVSRLRSFIRNGIQGLSEEVQGNTGVLATEDDVFRITLFGKPILCLHADAVHIHAGDFYDSLGRPSRTTRERLNGLLDALGDENIIPEGGSCLYQQRDPSLLCWQG